jgi:spore coat polysaccharide biosynthesis protein SpsF
MRSSRLPGKVLANVNCYPILNHVIARVKRATLINDVVVATTTNKEDDIIAQTCDIYKTTYFRGDPLNVLDRFYKCAKKHFSKGFRIEPKPGETETEDLVIRVTCDCPMVSGELIDKIITLINDTKSDYASNIITRSFPHGLDVEVFTFKALEKAWIEVRSDYDKEHVTPYMRNKEKFKIVNLESPFNFSQIRVTVDYPEDLEIIEKYYQSFYASKKYHNFSVTDIFNEYNNNEEIRNLQNKMINKYNIK